MNGGRSKFSIPDSPSILADIELAASTFALDSNLRFRLNVQTASTSGVRFKSATTYSPLIDHRVLSATDEMIKYLEIGNRMLIGLVESIGKLEIGSWPDFKDLQELTEVNSGKIASFTGCLLDSNEILELPTDRAKWILVVCCGAT